MQENWPLFFLIALAITGSGFVQSSLGFGYAIVALGILPYFFDIRQANVIVSLTILVPLVFSTWAYRRGLEWPTLLWCLGGAAIGLPMGLFVFSTIDSRWLVRGTGFAILLLALDGLFLSSRNSSGKAPSFLWTTFAGAASGLLAGAVGVGGPPVVAYASRHPWSPNQIKAFLLSFSLMLSLLRVFGLAMTGWIDEKGIFYSAIALPFGLIGGYLGTRFSRKIDALQFRRITMAVLLLLSIGMLTGNPPRNDSQKGKNAIFSSASTHIPPGLNRKSIAQQQATNEP